MPGTEPLIKAIDKLGHIVLRITNYVMLFAPIAVFAAITAIITTQGVGVLVTYGTLLVEYYFSLGCCGWCCSWSACSSWGAACSG
ncbi:MAG: cation:dicarboxylase symporter family transporter [Rhodospirillales bacterium]